MDDTDLNLSLNLNLTSTGTYLDKKKQKVFGNRSERIKQRKQIKYQKQKAETAATDGAAPARRKRPAPKEEDPQEKSRPPAKRARKDGASTGVPQGPRGTEKGVISSLFRHNPHIPAVKSQRVKAVREEVFSSTKFSDLPLHPHLVGTVQQRLGLTTMTRVQQMSIPVILGEKDILIKSQTGSGKTLAYAVPLVHSLASLPRPVQRSTGPLALVIVPTRELAIQSYETFSKLLQSSVWIVAGCLMGGEKRKTEKARIRKGINIVVSTPGRLLDHLQHTSCLRLDRVRWLVVDEADRLLELGYEKDVAQVVTILNSHCQHRPQTILLSATLSPGVERLSGMMLTEHETVDASLDPVTDTVADAATDTVADVAGEGVGRGEAAAPFSMPEKLRQFFAVVPCKLRLVSLAAFLLDKCKTQQRRSKMVVFFSTQDSVHFHHHLFQHVLSTPLPPNHHPPDGGAGQVSQGHRHDGRGDMDLFKLHGDMAQKDRTQVFQQFSEAASGVLLCTDVAARGLHLPGVDWIVQYSTPAATVDYIHRVGRTARAGHSGRSLLFLMPREADYVQELNKQHISVSEVAVKDILTTLLKAIPDLPHLHTQSKRQMPRTYEEAATFMQDRFEENILKNHHLKTLATKGYQSFVRAYAAYPSHLKAIFCLKDLHLGHVAKTFALREAPSHLQGHGGPGGGKGRRSGGNFPRKLTSKKKGGQQQKKQKPLSATVSEFGSGLTSGKGTPTKHRKHKEKAVFG